MKTEVIENPGTNRIEAFSDGILAIVITLMVLEIKIPAIAEEVGDREALIRLKPILPKLLSYALSFVMIAIFWVSHHDLFHSIQKSTRSLLWLNNLWLFWICLLPFPTAFLGDHPDLTTAAVIFGAELFFCALSFFGIRYYCYRQSLFNANINYESQIAGLRKSALAPTLYLLATVLSLFSILWAYAIFVLVPLLFIVSFIKR